MRAAHGTHPHFTDRASSGDPRPGDGLHPRSPCKWPDRRVLQAPSRTPRTIAWTHRAIERLSSLERPCRDEPVTDSHYVARESAEWLPKWERQGWQRKEGRTLKPVSNVDLWQKIDSLLGSHQVQVTRVLGLAGTLRTRHAIAWPSRRTASQARPRIVAMTLLTREA